MKTVKHHEQVFNCLMEKNQEKNLIWKQHSTSCTCIMYASCLYLHSSTPTTPSTLQPHHTPSTPYMSAPHILHMYHPHHPPTVPAITCFLLCLHRPNYDLLREPSTVDPSLLRPAEQLQWSISSETAKDIDIAKKNLDKCVCALASFQDSHLGRRLYVCALCGNLPRETSSLITRIIRDVLADTEVHDCFYFISYALLARFN